MSNRRKTTDSILYNIFRFEGLIAAVFSYPAYLLFGKPLTSSISETRDEIADFREYLVIILKGHRATGSGRLVMLTAIFLLVTPWNIFCSFIRLHSINIWMCGWIVMSVAAFVTLIKADKPTKYLKEFKKKELKSLKRLRRSAFLAFLIMIGIWSIFVVTVACFAQYTKR